MLTLTLLAALVPAGAPRSPATRPQETADPAPARPPAEPSQAKSWPPPAEEPPRAHTNVVLLVSRDGKTFEPPRLLAGDAAGVALCARRDGSLLACLQTHLDDASALELCESGDGGNRWSAPRPISIEGLPADSSAPEDPCLVELPDGRLRLYFSARRALAGGPSAAAPWTSPATYSALSGDGRRFVFEPGARFAIPGSAVAGACVVLHQSAWHLFAPVEGRDGVGYHATSADGVAWRRLPDVELADAGRFEGSATSDGYSLRFFGSGRLGWSATSLDGLRWKLDPRLSFSGIDVPSALRTGDGAWLLAGAAPAERGDPEDPDGEDPDWPASGAAQIAANANYVYVLRGDRVYMFESSTLRFLRSARVPRSQGPR